MSESVLKAKSYKVRRALYLAVAISGVGLLAAQGADTADNFVQAKKYLAGQGVPKNAALAAELFQKAADEGNVEAKAALGFLYAQGLGVPMDEALAVKWLREAANAGSAKAQFNLAKMIIEGRGTERNVGEAERLMAQAAAQDMPEAEMTLADWYYFGDRGLAQDYGKAFPLYLKEAERGNASAQNTVGFLLSMGFGIKQDREKGAAWFRKAADQGFAKAEANLGMAYITGNGVRPDKMEALKWLFRAQAQGEATGANALKDFAVGMTPEEIEEGRRRAKGDAATDKPAAQPVLNNPPLTS